jgi:hypothetical protein
MAPPPITAATARRAARLAFTILAPLVKVWSLSRETATDANNTTTTAGHKVAIWRIPLAEPVTAAQKLPG